MRKFEDGVIITTNKEFFARTYNKEKGFICPCGEPFSFVDVDIDTELECEACGTLISFEPVAWRVCVEKSDSLVLKEKSDE